MAVQAQHPSNLIFLDRNGQEGQDFSLQPQQGGFLDQTHMLFNNGGSNLRKRGRESTGVQMNNHQISEQSQFPQVIDMSLLHSQHYHRPPPPPPPPNIVSTGLRLSSGQEQPQSFTSRQFRHENHQSSVSRSSYGFLLSVFPEDFAAQINRQREELDEFLHAQAEELRRTLAEKRQRHCSALLRAVDEPLARKLREKEVEVDRATRRREELEARAAQLTADAQEWQARARAHEAAAASLQAQLQQAMRATAAAQDSRAAEEGLMCAGGGAGGSSSVPGTEDAESVYVDPDRVTDAMTSSPPCRACRVRAATVVLLPCRHLSLCPGCDRAALACPVCLTLRNSSVEVLLC